MPIRRRRTRGDYDGDTRALISNTTALLVGRYIVAAIGWVGTLLIVRNLSTAEWGRFTFVFSLLGLMTVVTDLNIGRVAMSRMLDEGTDRAQFAGTYVMLRATLGVIGYLLALGYVLLAGYPQEVIVTTAVAGLVVIIATPSNGLDIVFQANLRMRTPAVATVLGQTAQFALTAAIAARGGSVLKFAFPAVLFDVVVVAWKLRGLRRIQPLHYSIDWKTWRALTKESVPLALGGALSTIYYRIDSVMLSKLDTFTAVGIYGISYKFVDLFHYLPIAIAAPLLTVLVRSYGKDQSSFHRAVRSSLALLTTASLLILVEFSIFARPVITTLYGKKYAVGAGAAKIVIAGACLHFISTYAVTLLIAVGRNRWYPVVALTGAILNIALNLWLIPAHSYRGAAIATVLTEVVVAMALWAPLINVPGVRPLPYRELAVALTASGVAALVGYGAWRLAPYEVAGVLSTGAFVGVVLVSGAGGRGLLTPLSSGGGAAIPPP